MRRPSRRLSPNYRIALLFPSCLEIIIMVLSPLTGSYLHGDNTLMAPWGLECLLSSPWARPGDIRWNHNLSNRGGRSGAFLNPHVLRRLLRCISTMGQTPVVEGSASRPRPRVGTRVHWSSAWRSASFLKVAVSVSLMCDFSSQRKRYMTPVLPPRTTNPPCPGWDCLAVAMRYHLGAGISHHYPQMLLRLDLVEYSGLDMRGVGGVFHRGRSGKLCSVCIVLVCTTNVNLIWPRDRPFLCCVHPKSIGLDDA